MNKLLKSIIFSAMLVNLGSLLAMDGADHDISQNPFSLNGDQFQPIAHESADRWDWLGLDMSAAEPISAPALEPDATTRTVRAVLDQQDPLAFPYDNSWLNFTAAGSSEPTTSTAAPKSDTVVDIACETDADGIPVLATSSSEKPARKTRRKSLSATSASSSSASAASSTDVSAPSSTGASCSSADDDPFQYCKPFPVHCPWPDCTDHDTYFSPPGEQVPGLTNLSKHIKNVHKPKHEPNAFFCPHTDCNKSFNCHGRLAEHLLSAHNRTAAFQCNICAEERTFNTKKACERHVQDSHKQVGKYHCNCNSGHSTYSGWCRHIHWCQKIEERIRGKRYFWCPCGDACTEKEALRHAKLCARSRSGMVYIKQKKIIFGAYEIYLDKDGISTHDECMKLLSELERTSDSSADTTSASSSNASASSSTNATPFGEK